MDGQMNDETDGQTDRHWSSANPNERRSVKRYWEPKHFNSISAIPDETEERSPLVAKS